MYILQYISLSNIININLSEQLKSALECYSCLKLLSISHEYLSHEHS